MSTVDQQGYKVELALAVGFTPHPTEDEVYVATEAQVIELVDRAREQGANAGIAAVSMVLP